MTVETGPTAEYFDGWYANMAASPVKDEIVRRHLGLPAHLLSTSLLGWDAVLEVEAALRLEHGHVLLDLACGRGGYGLEIAHRSGARLVGVDFSGEAVRQAREYAERLGRVAEFRVGDLGATGLADASVNAVMCIDAVQFAQPSAAVYRELHRVLAPAGRAVLTCWEPVDRQDVRLKERLRTVDLRAGLVEAGFTDVVVEERPDWRARELRLWQEAADLEPGGDPALRALHDEGVKVLEVRSLTRRVMASATAGSSARSDLGV
jgi:SAM-dependent methyltransferase